MAMNTLALALVLMAACLSTVHTQGTFTLENDRFMRDGKPTQLISGRYAQAACFTFPTISVVRLAASHLLLISRECLI